MKIKIKRKDAIALSTALSSTIGKLSKARGNVELIEQLTRAWDSVQQALDKQASK